MIPDMKSKKKLLIPIFIGLFLVFTSQVASCQKNSSDRDELPIIKEKFHTDRDEGDNVDSPTIWHGPDRQHWLMATAKEGDAIIVYDANDGSFIERVGGSGTGEGEFDRPNGIAVIDDLLLIVERNNKRVQVLRLPDFSFIGNFGQEGLEDGLIKPYGISAFSVSENTYEVYVSDNYNPYLEGYPAEGELEDRIHHYKFTIQGDSLESEQLKIFGEVYNEGALHKVESIWVDREYNRLLIADEAYPQRNVKVYDLEGNFTGEIIPKKYFDSEPEGIALYECEDGSGYWIVTDQHKDDNNKYQLFDRETLDYVGGFKGELTRNTDGIWLTQKAFGDFQQGAFYPVHNDGSVTAIAWADIANALSLKRSCTQ